MRRRVISYTLMFMMVFSLGALGLTYGGNDKKDDLSNVQKEIDNTKQVLNQGKAVENKLNKQIKDLESNMVATQAEIDALKGSINITQEKINAVMAEIDVLEAEMGVQNDNLNARLRAMYINGNIGFFDVLLGSNSISDFMTNLDRVQLIYENDKEVIESLERQHLVIDAQRQTLLNLQAGLEKEKAAEASKKEALKENKTEVAAKKAEVAKDNKALEAQLDQLNAEADRMIAEIIALQGGGEYLGGKMGWPVPGVTRVTSEFGNRIHPILKYKKLHTGMDIGAKSGTTVVAASGGTVIKAGWNDSYGYLVMIDHGGGIVTLYAHNSSLLVNTGDVVARSQAIAKSGTTGMSTGPHVHFEVRVNGEYKNPRDWL